MATALLHPPKTLMEVYRMLPEGTRAEIINGTLYMSPAPFLDHQRIIIELSSSLHDFVKEGSLGEVFTSPVDVYLNQQNAYQPDIIFVASENSSILKEDGIYGAPDLIIEVLSPGTSKSDLTKKKPVYEKVGVKEYWVVDPKTKLAIGFRLIKNKYEEFRRETGKLNSGLLHHTFKF